MAAKERRNDCDNKNGKDYADIVCTVFGVLRSAGGGDACARKYRRCGGSVTAAEGEGGESPATDSHANHDDWTALTSGGGTLSSGNYYMSADVQLQNPVSVSGEVTLCLNGYVLRGNGTRFVIHVLNGGSLTLCDCQSESEEEWHRHNYYVTESSLYVFDDGTEEWTAAYNAAENTGTVAGGAIAGIVIGSILGAFLIAYGVCALLYKKKLVKGAFFEKIYPFIK